MRALCPLKTCQPRIFRRQVPESWDIWVEPKAMSHWTRYLSQWLIHFEYHFFSHWRTQRLDDRLFSRRSNWNTRGHGYTLNALFDMYSDAAFDYDTPVYRFLGFNVRLKSLQGSVQARVKSLDKRTQGPTRARGEEAFQNLKAFVAYKESEVGVSRPSRWFITHFLLLNNRTKKK